MMPSLASTLRSLMDLMECLLSSVRTVSPSWHPAWSNSFASACQHLPFLPAGSMASYSLCVKRMTYIYYFIYFPGYLKLSNQSLTGRFKKHLSNSELLSYPQYGFHKGRRSTGDLLSLLTDSWSSSISRFGETFAVAPDISKSFDSLARFLSFSFLSGRSISAVVDGHSSSPKPINSGVLQGSVLSPSLFLLFINDLSINNYNIHSYVDDSTLHFSTFFELKPMRRHQSDITFQTRIPYSSTTHSYHPLQH